MRKLLLLASLLLLPVMGFARQGAYGDCVLGGKVIVLNGLNSTTKAMASYPSCTVTVSIHGGGLATIYSDNSGTVLANPFTATTAGHWQFFADNGHYDVLISGGTPQAMPSSFTYSDIILNDTAQNSTAVCGLSFNASIIFTASTCSVFTLTLTGNVTSSTVTGAITGQQLIASLCQDATGSRTFAWPGNFIRPPTISTGVGSCTNVTFFYDGTNWRQTAATGDSFIAANGGILSGTFAGTPTFTGATSLTGGGTLTGTFAGSPTFTGNPTISGSTTLSGGGSLSGTFTGNPIASGNWTLSGNNLLSGTNTGTGTLNQCRTNTIRLVDAANTCTWSGADAGAWINSAYADLPTGTIQIAANASCYLYSTPIVFGTIGKLVTLRGAGATSSCLQYTGTTGAAITIDNYNGNAIAATLEDLELKTVVVGATTTGLSIGPTNNGSGTRLNRMVIDGFQTPVLSQTYGVLLTDTQLGPCSTAANSAGFQTGSNNIADDNRIHGGQIIGCSTLISNLSSNPLWVDHVILANATVGPWVTNAGGFHCTDCHFFNQSTGPTTNWFTNGSGAVSYYHNGIFEDAKTTGTPASFAAVSGGVLIATNNVFVSSGETVTEAILFSGSGQGFISGNTVNDSTKIPLIANLNTGNVQDIELPTNTAHGSSMTFDTVKSSTINPASTGIIRLATGDSTCWRNVGNSVDDCISKNSSDQLLYISNFILNSPAILCNPTLPTVSSGFGTSPVIQNVNTTCAFQINVGTGGTATSGIIGLPTAPHGWACDFSDITTSGATVFMTRQLGSSTTTATIANFNTSGAQAAWAASDILTGGCKAF